MKKRNIKSLSHKELESLLYSWGVEGYRFNQLYAWLFRKDVASFDQMTNISKALRERLQENFFIGRLVLKARQKSIDGTEKFLFQLNDGEQIESVLIPNNERQTLCISSQVGCAMGCTFCLTGTLGLKRNLSHFEMVEQVMAVQRLVKEKLSNVVYMGMGEPLHNLDNLLESLTFLLNERGLNFSKNKITVSTCGLIPPIQKFGNRSRVKLAISLTGTTDAIRDRLIPVNKRYPLEKLMKACREYPLGKGERITFEYTLLEGINDSPEDAKRLIELLKGIPAKVNLIPFNEYPGDLYRRSSDDVMLVFQKYLLDRGIQTNIRHSRGRDILGACGQLKAEMEQRAIQVS